MEEGAQEGQDAARGAAPALGGEGIQLTPDAPDEAVARAAAGSRQASDSPAALSVELQQVAEAIAVQSQYLPDAEQVRRAPLSDRRSYHSKFPAPNSAVLAWVPRVCLDRPPRRGERRASSPPRCASPAPACSAMARCRRRSVPGSHWAASSRGCAPTGQSWPAPCCFRPSMRAPQREPPPQSPRLKPRMKPAARPPTAPPAGPSPR